MKYRSKPNIVEAMQWDGTLSGANYIKSVFRDLYTLHMDYNSETNRCSIWKIRTINGGFYVNQHDYITRDADGNFDIKRPFIFLESYEAVE